MGFAYPPYTALVFAPLALLPWGWAGWTFMLLAPPLVAFSVMAWIRLTEAHSNPILIIAAVFASLPFLWGLRLENVTLLVVPLIAAGCLLLKDRPVIAGVLLAMSTVKPQLVFLLVAFLVVWSIIHDAWSFLASFVLTLSAMLLAATLLLPGWVHLWRASMADYVTYTHVSVLLPWPMEGALLLLVFAVLWKLRHDFGAAISLALAATLAAIPVNLPTTYNYLLLIPACLILLDARPDGKLAPVLRQIALLSIVAEFELPLLGDVCTLVFKKSLQLLKFNELFPLIVTIALVAISSSREVNSSPEVSSSREVPASCQPRSSLKAA